MAEDPRFILHFKTLAKFKEKLADGTISENRHLVFIKDEKLVWCRGIFYSDASKLDNFNSYYNDWSIDQSDINTITITLKGNKWNSTTRKWEAISKAINLNAATGTIAGLMSAQDKRLVDIIDTANFLLADPTTDATSVTIHATHTDVNNETRNLKTSKTLTTATSTNAGILTALDKRLLDIINTVNFELTAPTTDTTNIILHTKRTNVNTETNNIADSETVAVRTLPAATLTTAGVMIALDKLKEDRITGVNYSISNPTTTTTSRIIKVTGLNPNNNTTISSEITIPGSSSTAAGLMISTDKTYLDSLHTATVGSGVKPIYLNNGTPTASSSTVGSGTKPVYLNAGTITVSNSNIGSSTLPIYMTGGTLTASSSTIGSSTRPVYLNGGTITAGTYTFGNGSGNAPISNGTVNTNLNADLLDGLHYSAFARADQSAEVDLNTVNGKGIMTNTANANATTARHYPIAEAGTLFYGTAVYNSANQIYGTYNTNRWFVRGGGGSTTTKTDWKELLHTGNYSTTLDGRYYTESEIDGKVNTINSTISTNKSTMDSHIANKSNPHTVTKAQVGLGNVTNESKATMFTNPAFTGTPTAPTAATATNNTQIATTAFVYNAINSKAYSLPLASSSTRGGVKVGFTSSGRNYAVQLSNELMYVNVPWTDTNTTYGNATQSSSGLMSSTDKAKLDNIASGANAYSLPLMTSTVRGGAKIGFTTNATNRNYAVLLSNEQMYVNVPWLNTTYSTATLSANGLLSANDKKKLDGIASGANAYSLPLAANGTRGGVQIGYTANGKNYPVLLSGEKMYVNVPWTDTNTTYSNATQSAAGLMSSTDKAKLDGIASGANKYVLPSNVAFVDVSNNWSVYLDFSAGAGKSSDIRFKTNIIPVNNVLNNVLKIDIFNYIWNKPGEPLTDTFGVSAQLLEQFGDIFSKLVHIRNDEDKTRSVEYDKLGVIAIKAILELYKEVVELKKELLLK